MAAGDVEAALDVYDDMLGAGLRADARTDQILGEVWRR
jgi:pentatricopeptide repeat protein